MATQPAAAPLLSVTVLNYNYGHFLPTCLDSILGQSFTDFELILINDKSTDNSLAVIGPYLKDPRIRLVDHQENQGFVRSLIEGADISRGKYITVISADDWVARPTAFEQQIAVMERDAAIAFVYSAYDHHLDEANRESTWVGANASYVLPGLEAFKQLVVNPFLLHTGTVIRKLAYDKVGGYDRTTTYLVDTRMWLSLCHVGKVAYIDEALYAYRRHGKNMSRSAAALQREIREVLNTISWSFEQHPDAKRRDLVALKAEAERRALIAFAMDDIFRDHYQAGWQSFMIALRMRPLQTLLQPSTAAMALRTVLGGRGYSSLRGLKTKLVGPRQVAAAAK